MVRSIDWRQERIALKATFRFDGFVVGEPESEIGNFSQRGWATNAECLIQSHIYKS